MSKIQLTPTAEHYQAAKEIEYLYYLEHEDKQDFASYCDDRIKELSIPTQVKYTEADMLEFDVPKPTLLEQVADKLKDKELFPKSVAKGKEYFTANPLTLEFDVPSPWRTDIENAPRDGRKIFIIDCNGYYYVVYPLDRSEYYTWGSVEYGIFGNNGIAYWMLIPELPKP